MLLIDDIQFLEGKEGLQEEFFHTFNSLHGANKQIVISSDRMPDAIPTLEERLRGRFKWGLITDIQPPDVETRLAILRNKAEREQVQVPAETLEFIATQDPDQHPRARGGADPGHRLRQPQPRADHHRLAAARCSPTCCTRTRQDAHRRGAARPRSPASSASGRGSQAARAGSGRSSPRRQTAMYVFRELTDLSYPAIARLFGGRDHTTVIHAVDKIQRLMRERKQIYDQVTDLIQRLKTAHDARALARLWTARCGHACIADRADNSASSTEAHACHSSAVGRRGQPGDRRTALTLGRHLVVHNPQDLLPLLTRYITSMGEGRRCEVPLRTRVLGRCADDGRAGRERSDAARCRCCRASGSTRRRRLTVTGTDLELTIRLAVPVGMSTTRGRRSCRPPGRRHRQGAAARRRSRSRSPTTRCRSAPGGHSSRCARSR